MQAKHALFYATLATYATLLINSKLYLKIR